ncbi:Beta-1,3-galactosyltransferase [Actinidia chinensis var. chinensis]|uniref:Hexosyltransferase n=1 Tax=Actinidia chinensis var. chinensis TaxID=1590841 RepID=A0A2R6Q1A8_ACTCC|nr:Beta-1,3-galactosyltransferase [Actinidia chinensis var. chinensis]
MRVKPIPAKLILMLCIASFLAGSLFTSRTSIHSSEINTDHRQKLTTTVAHDSDHKRKLVEGSSGDIMGEVMKTHQAIQSLDKTISTLEMELAVARARKSADSHLSLHKSSNQTLQKVFAVIGINTAFSSKKRRNSLRETWMPRGDKLKKLEREKGIIIRFVIGHSATPGGVLDRAIDAEEAENKDFLRLKHVEGYHELSTKTRLFFSTVISIWDAEFYVKVDDDVHLNLGTTNQSFSSIVLMIFLSCVTSLTIFALRRHASEHTGTIPIKTQNLYWLYEVWTSSLSERGKISRARVLEVWGRREQVLQTCHWSNLCHLQGPCSLHLYQLARIAQICK